MFCKWCGGTVKPGDLKCSRCGRAPSAMSDCGGFYDLVKEQESAQPVVQQKPVRPVVQQEQKKPVALMVGVIAGFMVVLVLLVVLFVNQSKLTQEIADLESRIRELPETTQTEATEAAETTETIAITLPDFFNKTEEETVDLTEPAA